MKDIGNGEGSTIDRAEVIRQNRQAIRANIPTAEFIVSNIGSSGKTR